MLCRRLLICTFAATGLFLCTPAQAQAQYYDNREDLVNRLDRLEHDLQTMQRQVARGEPVTPSDDTTATASPASQVQASQFDENLRQLQGEIERLQHQNDELQARVDRMVKDMDYRMRSIEERQAAPAPAPAPAAAANPVIDNSMTDDENASGMPSDDGQSGLPPVEAAAQVAAQAAPPVRLAPVPANTARAQYDAALQLLKQHKYDEAGAALETFVQQYGKHPLAPNAYYWLGETYYVRSNFAKAADSFRQGFELSPGGAKAADNLFKLGKSLDALKHTKEACVVFQADRHQIRCFGRQRESRPGSNTAGMSVIRNAGARR